MSLGFLSNLDLNGNKLKNVYVDLPTQNGQVANKEYVDNLSRNVGDSLPIGTIVEYADATIPDNWLLCDGSEISRTTYADLFAVVGTKWGEGDGSTTFKLPTRIGFVTTSTVDENTPRNSSYIIKYAKSTNESTSDSTVISSSNNLVFYWDGQSSTDNADNLTLFQQIYELNQTSSILILKR